NVVTRAGITLNKLDDTQLWTAINALITSATRVTIDHQMFTTSATYTPNAKLLFCTVEVWGGGGGGGGAFGQPSPNVSSATGGASGAYAMRLYSKADIGAAAAVAIGAGGAAAPAGQNNGNDGGATTFATTGTGGTMQANGGGGGEYGITATTPTRGGFLANSPAAAGGHIMVPGTPGSWPLLFGGAAYAAISGSGGHAPMFASGGGQSAQEDANGNPGTYFGGGGAGGAATTVSRAGGAGFQGLCRVIEYCFG
ncbi:MAG TPA: hypothetical protein VN903_13290, partial [Polyangia bacterium]|nr:hypothetical protein [Polyangia bacterium]